MSDLISRSELIKAMETWDKFGYDEHNRLIRIDSTNEEYVPYVRYEDMVNCVMNMPTAYDIDKVVEYLELHSFEFGTDTLPAHYVRLNEAIEIVKQEAERCNSGWILCSERFPDECVPVNVTYINRNPEPYYAKIKDVPFSATAVYYNGKWYWYSSACVDYLTEYGKNDFDLVDKDIDIIAWMELPSAYIPKEK